MQLKFGPQDNQGSDAVFLTVIGTDGSYRQVERLVDNAVKDGRRVADE